MTQTEALDVLTTGQNVFLTGAAGSGKTYTLNSYIAYLRKHQIPVAVTASTGIAATHMDGRTVHSWSGIAQRKELSKKEIASLYYNTFTRNRVSGASVLIIDEISMLSENFFSLLDSVCKSVRNNFTPFGGLQMVVCGDFFQLPPVKKKNELPQNYAFHSSSWDNANFKVCYLEKQYRQEDPIFLGVLNDIRHNRVTSETIKTLKTRFHQPIMGFSKPTKLYSHRDDVDAINFMELDRLNTKSHIFLMVSDGAPELIKSLKESCLAPENLTLKEGALVMFVRNNFSEGYCNGTLGTVIGFEGNETGYPIIKLSNGEVIIANPVQWSIEDEQGNVIAHIEQVPLRFAWAITIHKSQGMTLEAAEVNLGRAFAHGMGYVALSRVRTLSGIKLLGINDVALKVSPEITAFDESLHQESIETKKVMFKDKKFLKSLQSDFQIRAKH